MNRAILGILWLFFGPLLSMGLGGIAYLVLEINYGMGGASTDGPATQAQHFYSSIAEPASLGIGGSGFFLSFWMAFKKMSAVPI